MSGKGFGVVIAEHVEQRESSGADQETADEGVLLQKGVVTEYGRDSVMTTGDLQPLLQLFHEPRGNEGVGFDRYQIGRHSH